jgi:hypothetical protein
MGETRAVFRTPGQLVLFVKEERQLGMPADFEKVRTPDGSVIPAHAWIGNVLIRQDRPWRGNGTRGSAFPCEER